MGIYGVQKFELSMISLANSGDQSSSLNSYLSDQLFLWFVRKLLTRESSRSATKPQRRRMLTIKGSTLEGCDF